MNNFRDSSVAASFINTVAEATHECRAGVITALLEGYSCPFCGVAGGTEKFEVASVVEKSEYFYMGQKKPVALYSRSLRIKCKDCSHTYDYPAGEALPEEFEK